MARKTIDITMPTVDGNRDSGKVFHLREMSAMQVEKWATRAMLALAHAGVDIDDMQAGGGGFASIALAGLQALNKLKFEEAEPLLDEMLTCVSVKPDPRRPDVLRPLSLDYDDIEEFTTILQLRKEVFMLHVGFFMPAKTPA